MTVKAPHIEKMVRRVTIWVAALVVIWACGGAPEAALAAPRAALWSYWSAHGGDAAPGSIDHRPWDAFLTRYVVSGTGARAGINLVRYGAVSADDRIMLRRYIEGLSQQIVTRLNRDEQRALWINLYNAATVRLVLAHYPVMSIRDIDISPGLFTDGPWGKTLLRLEGKDLSLDDIEHRILRPIWRDPRLHYALNCAALGCPNLSRTAFTADNAERLLDAAARAYINHPRGVAGGDGGGLVLSRIYDWYMDDFGGAEDRLIAHLRLFAAPALDRLLSSRPRVARYRYDWRLNDAMREPGAGN